MPIILQTKFNDSLSKFHEGKVRDIYRPPQWYLMDIEEERLFMIATDRISAFDVVLRNGIPDKGKVLTLLSAFWFRKTAHLIPNHFLHVVNKTWLKYSKEGRKFLGSFPAHMRIKVENQLSDRSMIVKKVERIPIECVVRGYLAGSAWAEYQQYSTVSGLPLPKGLLESQELPQPLFTPTTKAETGHDQPLTMDDVKRLVDEAIAEEMKEKSLTIYSYAQEYARTRGIIIADTKMEFGLDNGKLILIDELLTPDSSRFWDAEQYKVGQSQPSYDKQPVRDWLVEAGWNKEPPAPILPPEVIEATTKRYREAYKRLTGRQY